MNTTNNRSVKRTQALLRKAFFELLREKPVSKISVSELTDACNISRGTFYLHYHDVFDLLKEVETELLSELKNQLDQATIKHDETIEFTRLSRSFKFVLDHRKEVEILLGGRGSLSLQHKMEELIGYYYVDTVSQAYGQLDIKTLDIFRPYAVSGILGITRAWLARGCDTPPDELAHAVGTASAYGIVGLKTQKNKPQQVR